MIARVPVVVVAAFVRQAVDYWAHLGVLVVAVDVVVVGVVEEKEVLDYWCLVAVVVVAAQVVVAEALYFAVGRLQVAPDCPRVVGYSVEDFDEQQDFEQVVAGIVVEVEKDAAGIVVEVELADGDTVVVVVGVADDAVVAADTVEDAGIR